MGHWSGGLEPWDQPGAGVSSAQGLGEGVGSAAAPGASGDAVQQS